jgi:hypothetical protein
MPKKFVSKYEVASRRNVMSIRVSFELFQRCRNHMLHLREIVNSQVMTITAEPNRYDDQMREDLSGDAEIGNERQ